VTAAEAAGGKVTKPASETFYGGYAGFFRGPDGHVAEVAHDPGSILGDDGTPTLPDFASATQAPWVRAGSPASQLDPAAPVDGPMRWLQQEQAPL
jgi:hypothetical protein